MNTISFYTLGCRLNQSETASIENSFRNGYKVVRFDEPADVVVINTCTVTENGDADTRRLVNKINRINPKSKIALIGCQAQVQKEKLTKLPNVRWVVGNGQKMDLFSIIDNAKDTTKPEVIAPTIPKKDFTIDVASIDYSHTRANIKIQDGCDFFCSFCEIPYARGRARSRNFENIQLEANALVAAGHKELVLTGINLGTYSQNNHDIIDVITALEQIDGLERIRISSIEPTTIPEALIKKMATKSKLCRYLHIPLQSGSNYILKQMARKYTAEEFKAFIDMAYQCVPEICIGTDVIVGFPGEEESHFNESLELLKELPTHYFHVFSYSKRTMAKSRLFGKPVPQPIIQKRSQILRDLSQRKRTAYYESMIGTKQNVLFEQQKEGYWTGLTDQYIRVKIHSNKNLQNSFLPIKLKATKKDIVIGAHA